MVDPVDISSARILLIEDETFMRRLILRVLFELGVKETYDAANGEQGLAQVKALSGRLDLIICDLDMPVMPGLDFIENLRGGVAGVKDKNTPVIILTGHSDKTNIQRALQLGIQGFLVKPVSAASLEKRIRLSLGSTTINPETVKL